MPNLRRKAKRTPDLSDVDPVLVMDYVSGRRERPPIARNVRLAVVCAMVLRRKSDREIAGVLGLTDFRSVQALRLRHSIPAGNPKAPAGYRPEIPEGLKFAGPYTRG